MTNEQIYRITKKFNPEVIDEILRIEKESGLDAENLLEVAKNKDSPLHEFFCWDNLEASNNWRLHQARMLINEVKILVGEKFISAFESVSINVGESSERMYKPFMEIISNADFKMQLVKRALENVMYWQQQNKMYSELKPIFVAITKTKKNLEKKWEKK